MLDVCPDYTLVGDYAHTRGNLPQQIHLSACFFWEVRGNNTTRGKPTWTCGEHEKLHTNIDLNSESNRGPRSCEVAMLCAHLLNMICGWDAEVNGWSSAMINDGEKVRRSDTWVVSASDGFHPNHGVSNIFLSNFLATRFRIFRITLYAWAQWYDELLSKIQSGLEKVCNWLSAISVSCPFLRK